MKNSRMSFAVCMAGVFFLNAGEITAGEFGGFQVDVGVGENTGLPGDWKEESDFSQNETKDSDIQEDVWQDNGGNTWETPGDNAGGFGRQSENMEADTGNTMVLENSGEENGGDSEEEFLFSDGSEYDGYLPQRDLYESLEEPTGQEQGSIAKNTGENIGEDPGQIGMEETETDLKSEIVPAVTPLTTVTPTPVSNQAGEEQNASVYADAEVPEVAAENKKRKPEEIIIKENRPELLYWKKEFSSGQPVFLEIRAKGEVKVLSFRINGKENGWKWKGDRLMALENETDAVKEKAVAELILLYYDTSGHGIFIDGNRKQ